MDIFSLKNKVALVTGAAHGIGFQMAVALANAGAKIAFNSSNESSMKKGIEEYHKLGIDAFGFVCDVRDEFAVNNMIDVIIREIG
jgi:gluconate 5-dehydrogenase